MDHNATASVDLPFIDSIDARHGACYTEITVLCGLALNQLPVLRLG